MTAKALLLLIVVALVAYEVKAQRVSPQALLPWINSTWTDYRTTLRNFDGVNRALTAAKDRRGVFTTAYTLVNANLDGAMASFRHPAWVQSLMLSFLEMYRFALYSYVTGASAKVPPAWNLAFNSNAKGLYPLSDLLTGMEAHIIYDLPRAIKYSFDNDSSYMAEKEADFAIVGSILKNITGAIFDAIDKNYLLFPLHWILRFTGPEISGIVLPPVRTAAFLYGSDPTYRAKCNVPSLATAGITMESVLSAVEDLWKIVQTVGQGCLDV